MDVPSAVVDVRDVPLAALVDPRCNTACPQWREGECDSLCDPRDWPGDVVAETLARAVPDVLVVPVAAFNSAI